MGEKIKDLYPIHIGSAQFMIELNEAYSPGEERLIHIQNEKFRYQFKESDFFDIAENILRAKLKLDHIRSIRASSSAEDKKAVKEPGIGTITEESKRSLNEFCILTEKYYIDYRIIETGERYASIIISEDDYDRLRKMIRNNRNTTVLEHPYGRMFGYKFLYQMKPFELVKYKGIFIEFFFQFPCMSLTPKTWMPLEKKIQQRVWDNQIFDGSVKYIDNISLLIFKICWAVFKNGYFTYETKQLINRLMVIVDREVLRTLLKEVFFLFTDQLLELISQKRYDEIMRCYVTFCNY